MEMFAVVCSHTIATKQLISRILVPKLQSLILPVTKTNVQLVLCFDPIDPISPQNPKMI